MICFLCHSYTSDIEDDEEITEEDDNEMDAQVAFTSNPSIGPQQSNHSSEGTTQNLTFCNYCIL